MYANLRNVCSKDRFLETVKTYSYAEHRLDFVLVERIHCNMWGGGGKLQQKKMELNEKKEKIMEGAPKAAFAIDEELQSLQN
ncbi:hypothetical protein PR048_022480 [Dryococelus australis]|uniref:Uncharacterized protein n=1 Tax=Dryococelus australis TaxID=614101 RepID=A0ABQ9H183_9NEOP|nr:hypothetical protein PR048_022480 [Dryococelus australis]